MPFLGSIVVGCVSLGVAVVLIVMVVRVVVVVMLVSVVVVVSVSVVVVVLVPCLIAADFVDNARSAQHLIEYSAAPSSAHIRSVSPPPPLAIMCPLSHTVPVQIFFQSSAQPVPRATHC